MVLWLEYLFTDLKSVIFSSGIFPQEFSAVELHSHPLPVDFPVDLIESGVAEGPEKRNLITLLFIGRTVSTYST